jgi:hypothetical protein
MLPPKSPVYQLRVDGQLKVLSSADLDLIRSEAKAFSDQGRRVEIIDRTTGKVIDA